MRISSPALLPLFLACLLAAATAGAYPAAPGFRAEASDARAVELADATMAAMGGWEAWNRSRYLQWTFFSGRTHTWDKWTGRLRMEDPRNALLVLMNLNDRSGRAWKNGAEVTDPAARREALDSAYAAWVNDSYWLLMPYKLKDSGVALRYVGEGTTLEGAPAEVIELTFEKVGLTPQNKYRVWIDANTRLVSQWAFYRSAADAEPAFTLPWKNWRRHGPVLLSDDRGVRDGREMKMGGVAVPDSLPDAVFEDPQ